ncbi:MAG: hypothetical protein WD972_00710 [Candidatus Andersenbacteria bacterium]
MPDLLILVHERLGVTALYYFLFVSAWGYYRFFTRQGINSAYWGMLAIAEGLILVEVFLGIYMWLAGFPQPARGILHVIYGAIIPIMIPGAYFYTRGRGERAEILVYSTAAIITCGLILRAIYTAQVPL